MNRETETPQSDLGSHHNQEDVEQPVGKTRGDAALIGKITHDFNNLLLVILASVDLLLLKCPTEDPMRSTMLDILEAGTRAADLTRKLRTLSLQPGMIALNQEDIERDPNVEATLKCDVFKGAHLKDDQAPSGEHFEACSERIMVVTDDCVSQESIRNILESQGYMILPVPHGKAAIATVFRSTLPVHLVMTDILLPELSVAELADVLTASFPDLPILFMGSIDEQQRIPNGDFGSFVRKPIDSIEVLTKVREILGSRAARM